MKNLYLSCCLAFICLPNARAQIYLGLYGNYGNRMHYSGSTEGFDRPGLLTGCIGISVKRELINNLVVIYGMKAGVIGYSVRVHAIDTLRSASTPRATFIFPDYSTLYGTLEATVGKELPLGNKSIFIGVGSGITYAHSPGAAGYGITTHFPDGTTTEEFYAETTAINRITVLAKVASWYPINKYLIIGLEFNRHFSSIIDGHYEFYHTRQPANGIIKLYQTEISLAFLVRISRH